MVRFRRYSVALSAIALLLFAGACAQPGASSNNGAGANSAASGVDDENPVELWDEPTEKPDPDADASVEMGAAPTTAPPKPKKTTTKTSTPRTSARKTTEKALPPPPKKAPADCKPHYEGTQASRADAKKALTDAAGRVYWPTSAPSIRVPLDLVKATAYQESGWQSNIIACDTGVGLMQVQPPTAKTVNDRFGQNYDLHDYRDNATLGANYFAWLIKYFGDNYFDANYSVDPADCDSHTDLCLLNVVIGAYNVGFGNMEPEFKLTMPEYAENYVDNVRSLMDNCVCLSW